MHDILKIAKYWAIEPDSLKSICCLKEIKKEIKSLSYGSLAFNSLAFHSERRLNNSRSVLIRDGTAIIPLHGPITNRSDLFTYLIGGTSLSDLAKDFQVALDDDQVKAILFDIDSPGGVALGPSEMAEAIFKSRLSSGGKKPIWSYVGANCSSAAYWIASACDKIIANPSAILGSIGVVTTIPVQEQPDSEGYKNIEIVSSNAKQKRPDPRTAEGMTEIKRELDDLESQFIESIAKYRSVTINKVKTDFGQGGVLIGKNAVAVFMADALGSYEEVISQLNQKISNNNQSNQFMSIDQETKTKQSIERSAITADFIKTEFPDIAQKLAKENSDKIRSETKETSFIEGKKAGLLEGAELERKRILAIEEASLPGCEDLVLKAKQDGDMTADKLALQIINREKQRGTKYLEQLAVADDQIPQITPNLASISSQMASQMGYQAASQKTKINQDAPLEERVKSEWQNDTKIRAEFADDYEAYFAYRKAFAANRLRILSSNN